ncbi:MAG: DUF1576 domain-containing protein [Oscillospiraceae bacterium]|nr:DUF1576 domain-containing protein [Oscillospiraceae bacterium]
MKNLNKMHEDHFLKIFFTCFSLSFIIASLFMPDVKTLPEGLLRIMNSPTKAATNFFDVGGYAATFMNMGLVGLICTCLYCIPGRQANNAATLVTLLTVGFGSWGIHILNIWPTILGVALHCVVKGEKLGSRTNAMLFSTGLAPFISELMVRYPYPETVGIHPSGVALALIIGVFVGYFLPAGLDNSPKIHKGFALYSAALPIGMTAFLLNGFLYKAMGVPVPEATSDLSVADPVICNVFCIILFTAFIVVALLMGCSPKHYIQSILSPQHVVHFGASFGNAAMLMNAGVFGLFILAYFNIVGAEFNGIVFGSVFCMLSTCNSGSHPLNAIPIIMGYALASQCFQALTPFSGGEFTQFLHTQSIIVGICYANGLSPIAHEYGWRYGILVAAMHFCMVTTTPQLHGGMCLYNGGFTAALVCLLILPGMERHFRTKHERRSSYQKPRLKMTPSKH